MRVASLRSEPHFRNLQSGEKAENPKQNATLELLESPGPSFREERQTEWTALENWAKSGKDSGISAFVGLCIRVRCSLPGG